MSGDVHGRFCEGVGVRLPRATHLVVFSPTYEQAVAAQDLLSTWLGTRGLRLSGEKTHICHLQEGFNFLGCNIRHYPTPNSSVLIHYYFDYESARIWRSEALAMSRHDR